MNSEAISKLIGEKIIKLSPIGGGCIANAHKAITPEGIHYFVKQYGRNSSILNNEANGLKELAKANAVLVPEVIALNEDYLVLEFIEEGRKPANFFEKFGAQFAQLHKYNSDAFGFYENNFIGATPQINLPLSTNWHEFYWNNRLLFQYQLAEKNGYANPQLKNSFLELEKVYPKIIEDDGEPPSLLHGDLWSGNYMCNSNGDPVLIDPAVYYGNREADLAMTKLFGGFPLSFYQAYNEEFPLKEGWEYREPIYKLYHVLNHLNLFGYGYLSQAIEIIKFYIH